MGMCLCVSVYKCQLKFVTETMWNISVALCIRETFHPCCQLIKPYHIAVVILHAI